MNKLICGLFLVFCLVNVEGKTSTPQQNIQTVKGIYADFSKGNVQAVGAALASSYTWRTNAAVDDNPQFFNFDNNASAFFAIVTQTENSTVFNPVSYTSSATQVIAVLDITFQYIPTQKWVSDQEVHVWTFNAAGKITGFTQFLDTEQYADAAIYGPTPYSLKLFLHRVAQQYSAGFPISFYAPNAVIISDGQQISLTEAQTTLNALLASVPDLAYTLLNEVADSNQVVADVLITGHFTGAAFEGYPPNGKAISITSSNAYTVINNLIVRDIEELDLLDLLEELGIIP